MRLLLVEDEQRLSEALTYILKKNKYSVDVAYDGQTGLEMAETDIYDLIILDRMLPKKEGITVLKELRAQGLKTPILFSEQFQVGVLTLDPLQCRVALGENSVKLTVKESQLLELFMRNRGQVITKEQLLSRVWGLDSEVEINNVEIYVHYLRKKLEPLQGQVRIETIRGIGYCLKEDSNVSQTEN